MFLDAPMFCTYVLAPIFLCIFQHSYFVCSNNFNWGTCFETFNNFNWHNCFETFIG
jgi:hypothetical protein